MIVKSFVRQPFCVISIIVMVQHPHVTSKIQAESPMTMFFCLTAGRFLTIRTVNAQIY